MEFLTFYTFLIFLQGGKKLITYISYLENINFLLGVKKKNVFKLIKYHCCPFY